MKVILKQDVKALGKKDAVVEVNDGYARNYLIPKGLAVEATAAALNEVKIKQGAQKHRQEVELAEAQALKKKLSELTVVIRSKAGANGKLFGSITSKDIVEKIQKDFNITLDKKMINLPDAAIKTLGLTEVEVRLYQGVVAKLKVKVEPDETV
ncbi:MAG TPA: 50S ribosomal protein L9 [Thermoclostridium caenicola]|nr:50S ribosomal protein L9 [Thermoclostridium caenicola]